jgi:hypothetical protein
MIFLRLKIRIKQKILVFKPERSIFEFKSFQNNILKNFLKPYLLTIVLVIREE